MTISLSDLKSLRAAMTLEPGARSDYDMLASRLIDLINAADHYAIHATITLRITSPDGSVVDVTKQSEMARRGR